MAFRVGQKVVCVDDGGPGGPWNPASEIFVGEVYTVRALGLSRLGAPGIKLEELMLSSSPGVVGWFTQQPFVDACYRATRFRPIVERKTDISIFTKMLTDKKIGVVA